MVAAGAITRSRLAVLKGLSLPIRMWWTVSVNIGVRIFWPLTGLTSVVIGAVSGLSRMSMICSNVGSLCTVLSVRL